MSANIGWLFYKDYFKDINYNNLKDKKNESIIQKKVENIIDQTPNIEDSKELGNIHFKATTTYPGLILGSGNTHELPSIEGQAILGFHFDYTSGLPVISGSSIKGVLRSAFKHWEYIAELTNLNTEKEVKALESEIFDNADIFFDAEIIKADGFDKVLGDDFLAPHRDDPLKNPTPLRFIKVLPDVTFRFDFELKDGSVSKQTKSKLFQTILEDLGLGAKTNVGYGKFEEFSKHQTKEEKLREEEELKQQKELEDKRREQELENAKKEKEQKAKAGLDALMECKTFADGVKLLKESFTTAKPKLTDEQQQIVQKFYQKFEKSLTKKDKKALKKYGIG
jgi:CRISPR-associated protein Cmr6